MDSGNSGSLQSSSGDEEHDSRPAADSMAAFMEVNSNKRRAIHGIHANPLSHPSQINPTNFDPLYNYFDSTTISRPPPPSSFFNLDMPWSKTLRSDPDSSAAADDHHINRAMINPSSSNINPSFFGSFISTATTAPVILSVHPPGTENNNTSGTSTTSASATNTPRPGSDQNQTNPNPAHVVRNPKKRSRASRRAPTTVLTTDTTNFRAMVQEFTGIPAPPFTSSSPFSRTSATNPRVLDLYGGAATIPSGLRSNPLDSSQPPPYLRRPFPQKVQLPPPPPPPSLPFLASSSSASSSSPLLTSSSRVDLDHHTNNIGSTSAAAALNFHQLPIHQQGGTANLFNNLPNHLLLSSALLQSKFPPPNIGLEIPPSSKETHLKVGGIILDHHQFGHVTTTGLPGLISSDQMTSLSMNNDNNNNNNNPVNWDGNAAITNGKMNFSSSSTNNVTVAAAAAAASRGEGMVESWICSSD